MVPTVPRRSEGIMVRLSVEEKERLVRAAIKDDQRIGQLARRFINEKLSAINTEEAQGSPGELAGNGA